MSKLKKLTELYHSLKDEEEILEFWIATRHEFLRIGTWIEEGKIAEFCNLTIRRYLNERRLMNENIEKMVEEAYSRYNEIIANPDSNISIDKYVIQCQSVVFPVLFQPPIVTSSIREERDFIHAVFSRWDNVKLQLEYYKQLDIKFGRNEKSLHSR